MRTFPLFERQMQVLFLILQEPFLIPPLDFFRARFLAIFATSLVERVLTPPRRFDRLGVFPTQTSMSSPIVGE
jgi:hypothetical protein